MSKSDGLKIGIKFTEDIVGNISPPISTLETQGGDWSVNGTYGGSVANIIDGNTSTYWQSRSTANYIQISRTNTKLLGIKVYKGSSYRPSNFILRTSVDGTTYSDVKNGSFVVATGWETIMFDEPVISDYFRFNFGYSSRLYLYELVLIVEDYDNEVINDFVVIGKEHRHINSALVDKRYKISNIERHPTEPQSILLTFDWWDKFNNVVGDLTVSYDETKGNLQGAGGAVESFEVLFLPEDLIPTPNPNVEEYISVAPSVSATFLPVEYHKGYEQHTITVSPVTVTAILTDVSIINP